jgi:TfoX/Sxy family transcriptional regulator of competence genes
MQADSRVGSLECRHFFSGAAVYRDDMIVATLTPVGLAFKVAAEVHDDLIGNGLATPLRYFAASPVKRNYVLFPDRDTINAAKATRLILGEHMQAP